MNPALPKAASGLASWSISFGVGLLLALLARPVHAGENYALLVAVGDYDLKELRPLKYTRADILDFQKALAESGFPAANIVLMHDDVEKLAAYYKVQGGGLKAKDFLPIAANVRKELELLLGRLGPEDSVVVAFSGHGIQFKGEKKSYFCPSDAKLDHKDSLIAFEEVFAALKASAAGRKLLLIDACQNDPQSEIGKSRSTVDLDSITRPQSEALPEGIIALFSCRAGQKSFEMPELGHGIFFYHLLDAWKGKADLNGDGKLSYQELASYTEKKTSEYAAKNLKVLQTPQLKAEFSGEWVLRELSKPNLPPPLFDATRPRTPAEAKASQEEWAKHLKTTVEVENSIGMKLRLIPPGEYKRGSSESAETLAKAFNAKESEFKREYPQHTVRISKPFLLGATEVTRGQFRRFVSATGYVTDAEKYGKGGSGYDESTGKFGRKKEYTWKSPGFPQTDEHPVVNVSWNDATAFAEWLGREEGKTYRLPTEAEWEYTCRGGTTTRYQSGDDPETLASVGNVADGTLKAKLSDWSTIEAKDGYVFTAPVGKFRPNGFGLMDMTGNVWEWCRDWYDAKEYAKHAGKVAIDPQGPSGRASDRVVRGGGWNDYGKCRPAYRSREAPDYGSFYLGFRVAAVR